LVYEQRDRYQCESLRTYYSDIVLPLKLDSRFFASGNYTGRISDCLDLALAWWVKKEWLKYIKPLLKKV
jgi:hypothetical protein